MQRLYLIAKSRLKQTSLRDFIGMVKDAVFRIEQSWVYAIDLQDANFQEPCCSGGVEIKQAGLELLEQSTRRMKSIPWEFQCHTYDGVRDFFIAYGGGEIQHISWLYYKNHPNRLIRLNPLEAEIKYCLTIDRFRGQGLYPRVIRSIVMHLKKRAFRKVFMCVRADNRASIRGIEKAGLQRIGKVRLLKVAGIQISGKFRG